MRENCRSSVLRSRASRGGPYAARAAGQRQAPATARIPPPRAFYGPSAPPPKQAHARGRSTQKKEEKYAPRSRENDTTKQAPTQVPGKRCVHSAAGHSHRDAVTTTQRARCSTAEPRTLF